MGVVWGVERANVYNVTEGYKGERYREIQG